MSETPYSDSDEACRPAESGKGKSIWSTIVTILGGIAVLLTLIYPSRSARRAERYRAACELNLKLIAFALQNYESAYGALPPAYTVDADGKPLHSWRTLILPFLEQDFVYERLDLSKPWDDPANAAVYNLQMPPYHCPVSDCPETHTKYLAVLAPEGCFHPTEPRQLSSIIDRPSQTIMVVEVPSDKAVHWMSPYDASEELVLEIGPDSHLTHPKGIMAAFLDGHVEPLPADLPADQRRAMISIAGGEVVGEDDLSFSPRLEIATPPGWSSSEIHNLPPSYNGLTVTFKHASGIDVMLYQYTRGLRFIPEDLDAAPVQKEMQLVIEDFEEDIELGYLGAAEEKASGTVTLGASPRQVLWSQFALTTDGMTVTSDIYLWSHGKRFFKLRCTRRSDDAAAHEAALEPLLTVLGSSSRPVRE